MYNPSPARKKALWVSSALLALFLLLLAAMSWIDTKSSNQQPQQSASTSWTTGPAERLSQDEGQTKATVNEAPAKPRTLAGQVPSSQNQTRLGAGASDRSLPAIFALTLSDAKQIAAQEQRLLQTQLAHWTNEDLSLARYLLDVCRPWRAGLPMALVEPNEEMRRAASRMRESCGSAKSGLALQQSAIESEMQRRHHPLHAGLLAKAAHSLLAHGANPTERSQQSKALAEALAAADDMARLVLLTSVVVPSVSSVEGEAARIEQAHAQAMDLRLAWQIVMCNQSAMGCGSNSIPGLGECASMGRCRGESFAHNASARSADTSSRVQELVESLTRARNSGDWAAFLRRYG